MKKKIIEKIEYLKLPKLRRKKEVKYIGRTAVRKVADEKHFFLEVYKNVKEAKDVPVVRIVVNKKDFGTFWPETGSWSRGKITSNEYSKGLIWEGENRRNKAERRKESILYSAEDLERLKDFFKEVKEWKVADWWDYISGKQDQICNERSRREYERRMAAIKDRAEHTPELDKQKILEYAEDFIFMNRHYLYYKKKGRRAEVCCSKCGEISSGSFKPGISYESNFEKHIEEPRENQSGACPMCHGPGIYKCQGKTNKVHRGEKHIFLMDRYKETGVVVRYVKLEKEWNLEKICGEKGLEMHGAHEKLCCTEIARTYIHPEEKPQTDFQKYSYSTGENFWDDHNLFGLANIIVGPAEVYPGSWENLEGTCLQYSQAREFFKEAGSGEVALNFYMLEYINTPQIEMLVKMQLYGVVRKLVRSEYGIVEDKNAKSPDAFLGIRKDKVKFLIRHKGDGDILRILKAEKQMEENWKEEQIEKMAETGAYLNDLRLAMQFMTPQKMLNTIEKYAGCGYGTQCGHAMGRLTRTARMYFDYLSMRAQLGYDLTNTVYQKPKNLKQEHDKMVDELNGKRQEERIKMAEEKYPLIRKNYRGLRKRYLYEDEDYIIRPARSAEEIISEGRILHHCVGGDNYLDSHNRGKSVILMLRFKDRRDIPYITVEIKGEKIVQWYGANNKKPDEKNMQRWLDKYTAMLMCRRLGTEETTWSEADQPLLMPAAI